MLWEELVRPHTNWWEARDLLLDRKQGGCEVGVMQGYIKTTAKGKRTNRSAAGGGIVRERLLDFDTGWKKGSDRPYDWKQRSDGDV